jgi:hypothetical protein
MPCSACSVKFRHTGMREYFGMYLIAGKWKIIMPELS